ncbi:MAG: hypothetical protein JW958_04670 [Candidatus Eisenbacteria bacterium]|nr:hypothetical protein [Candidatus Eisenbacteria bacterium]
MFATGTSRYGGIAGRVLRETMTPGTFVTGLAVALPIGLLAIVSERAGSKVSPAALVQVAATLALARIALNGYAGQWRGTVFSKTGGSDFDVLTVAIRFVLLSSCWLIPLYLLGFRPGNTMESAGMMMMGMGGGEKALLGALYVMLVALSPPVFLIASVGASNIVDLFSAEYWRNTFGGRVGDIFLVYALYLGGLTMAVVLSLPLLVLVGARSGQGGILVGGAVGVYLLGFAVTLLGRLCGFFAASGGPGEEETADLDPSPILDVMAKADRPAQAKGGRTPVHRAVTRSAERDSRRLRASMPAVVAPNGRPVVTDAVGRVSKAEARFADDPDGAIEELRRLDAEYEPNPLVLCGLCRFLIGAGREDEAVRLADRAIPWSLARGSHRPAAEAYREFGERAGRLQLNDDDLLRIGNTLRTMLDLETAGRAYRAILDRRPSDAGAVKGMLQTAEAYVHGKGSPQDAIRVYDYLLERCPDSPLADFMHAGKEEAELRIARR